MIPKKPQGDSRMGTGKKKIEIKIKEKEQDRLVAFSKRRKGLYKKAHQLHSLSGAQGNFDEDFRDIDACMSWLGKMDFEACDDLKDLVSVKNDLESIRDKLVKRIGEISDCRRGECVSV
ncbi:hypothetical protein POM88_050082 [Heracleum sosnowskyi]|uniref:MADS-box domain-containing protein n=1 Tax=Heracleum sosnowskyi TaxID=360622 RepID=A0AAD8GY39_9APIA|nr:hypothetical protein POM88_050082 [Heracleum sosnowskyi]